jgi:hypothetical protein
VDNIKMDLREVGWDGRDWIDLAQDRDLLKNSLCNHKGKTDWLRYLLYQAIISIVTYLCSAHIYWE